MATASIDPPQLMGVTGDECASCNSTTAPLYDLSCHYSDDFHCSNCLTKMFYESTDGVILCPHPSCHRPAGFPVLTPLEQGPALDHAFHVLSNSIRSQRDIMNNSIAFTAKEAEVTFTHVYTMVADQVLDPEALGGISSIFIATHMQKSLQAAFDCNPLVQSFLNQMAMELKMVTTPYQLEEDLRVLLSALLHEYAKENYGKKMAKSGIDISDEDAVLAFGAVEYPFVDQIKENWESIIEKWVALLTWRHLERLGGL